MGCRVCRRICWLCLNTGSSKTTYFLSVEFWSSKLGTILSMVMSHLYICSICLQEAGRSALRYVHVLVTPFLVFLFLNYDLVLKRTMGSLLWTFQSNVGNSMSPKSLANLRVWNPFWPILTTLFSFRVYSFFWPNSPPPIYHDCYRSWFPTTRVRRWTRTMPAACWKMVSLVASNDDYSQRKNSKPS